MRIHSSTVTSPFSSYSSPSSHSSNSLDAPTNSVSSPSSISSPATPITRCEGLDLLVKAAAYYLTGSVVGVPYVQRRILIRRRRRREALVFNLFNQAKREEEEGGGGGGETVMKRGKRAMAFPSKYQDSVLQPWKRQRRCRRSTQCI